MKEKCSYWELFVYNFRLLAIVFSVIALPSVFCYAYIFSDSSVSIFLNNHVIVKYLLFPYCCYSIWMLALYFLSVVNKHERAPTNEEFAYVYETTNDVFRIYISRKLLGWLFVFCSSLFSYPFLIKGSPVEDYWIGYTVFFMFIVFGCIFVRHNYHNNRIENKELG